MDAPAAAVVAVGSVGAAREVEHVLHRTYRSERDECQFEGVEATSLECPCWLAWRSLARWRPTTIVLLVLPLRGRIVRAHQPLEDGGGRSRDDCRVQR